MKQIDILLNEREKYKKESNAIMETEILEKICDYYFKIKENFLKEYIYYLNELGGSSKYIGKYDLGIKKINEALDIIEKKYGKESIFYATSLLNLIEIYRFKGSLENLESMYLSVIKIYELNNMENSYEYSGACNNFALYYQSILNFDKAIIYHEKSLNILKDMKEHIIEYATTLNNLVMPYKEKGDILKAKEYLEKAIKIYLDNLGENHSMYGAALNNKALISFYENNIYKAINISTKALNIAKNSFGENSINYLNILENIKYFNKMLNEEKKEFNVNENSKLIDISREYTQKYILEEIKKVDKNLLDRISIAFIGEGSEIISLDDEYSKDHDYTFMPLILVDNIKDKEDIEEILLSLPHKFMGITHKETENIKQRKGVHLISQYLYNFVGKENLNQGFSIFEYRNIPEYSFFSLTSGEIFYDKLNLKEQLKNILYYPDNIWQDKLATRLSKISQAGQYNYLRLRKRNDKIASYEALSIFIENVIKAVYVLNRKYCPYYKWRSKLLKNLPILGNEIYERLNELINSQDKDMYKVSNMIDEICYFISQELQKQNISKEKDIFLLKHANYIQKNIDDPYLSLCSSFEGE